MPAAIEGAELAHARDIADQIVAIGSIITLPGLPLQRELVGHLEWPDESCAFCFPAFGERPADGHIIPFTRLALAATGICFVHDETITGYLCPIDKAAVEDPEDYRVAWRLWLQVLPLRWGLIAQSRQHCLTAHAEAARIAARAADTGGSAHPVRPAG